MSESTTTSAEEIQKRIKEKQERKAAAEKKALEEPPEAAPKPLPQRAYKATQDFETTVNNSFVQAKKDQRFTDPDDTYFIDHCLANGLPIVPEIVEWVKCTHCGNSFAKE